MYVCVCVCVHSKLNVVLLSQSDGMGTDLTVSEDVAPTKRQKIEGDAQFFQLTNDKNTTSLPNPFPFPQNYTPRVECALRSKVMPPEVMKKFLAAIARAVYSIKCYPTASEYESLGVQIIQRYPFLKSPAGCPYVSFTFV